MGVDLLRDQLVRVKTEKPDAPNEELDAWQREQGEIPLAPPERARVSGTCDLCNERPALALCPQCERRVCGKDRWTMYALCRECLTPDEMKKRHEASNELPDPPDLGIKWIEE